MESFDLNFNDDAVLSVKRSDYREGEFLVSVSTREFYASAPELEKLKDSVRELLKKEDDGQGSEDGEPSKSTGDDEESVEALLSETDTRSS